MNDRERAICARVRESRIRIKWPQPAYAYELGITKDQLASIEYARTPLKYSIGFLLCQLFDLSEAWLATGRGPVSPFHNTGPLPGNLPPDILFSAVYDSSMKEHAELAADVIVPTKSKAERELKRGPAQLERSVIADFDFSSHLIRGLLETLEGLKRTAPEAIPLFCREVIKNAQAISLRHQKRAVASRVRIGGKLNQAKSPRFPDLTNRSAATAAEILKLDAKVQKTEMEFEIAKADLDAALGSKGKRRQRKS